MWAVVDAAGNLVRDNGASGATNVAEGSYIVTFDQALSTCGAVATAAGAATLPQSQLATGFAMVSPNPADPNQLVVHMFEGQNGQAANLAFTAAVFC